MIASTKVVDQAATRWGYLVAVRSVPGGGVPIIGMVEERNCTCCSLVHQFHKSGQGIILIRSLNDEGQVDGDNRQADRQVSANRVFKLLPCCVQSRLKEPPRVL